MKALLEGLKALGPARIAALAAVAIGMFGILALMTLRGTTDQMALLYGDLDTRDASQMVDVLGRNHIAYRVTPSGNQIMVPADQVPETRLMLAKEGLPSGGSVGYEIFDRGDSFAPTDFQQKINETRALEGELVRTIRAIRGVRARACAPCAAAAPTLRPRPAGCPGRRLAHHGRRRPARPRRRAGDPQPGGRRGARIAAAEHRRRQLAWQPAGARRGAGRCGEAPRCPPRNCATPPNCASPARWRRCWSKAWARARCARKPQCA